MKINSKLLREVKKTFMGPRVTKDGTSKYWGTNDLHDQCVNLLQKMSTEEKLQLLIDHEIIDCSHKDLCQHGTSDFCEEI